MNIISKESLHIIIVDDNQKNIQIIGTLLRKNGFEISVAQSGKQSLEIIEKSKPDLILLDILMPEMDGFEVCSRLKANPETKDIPVIFLSALTDTIDKVQGFKVGAVDYVTKPIEAEELLARISLHLTIKNLQKKLEDANYSLEDKVKIRTRELLKKQRTLEIEIEEHKKTQIELNATKNSLKNIINSMPSMLVGVDENCIITHWNLIAEKETGVSSHNAIGSDVSDVFKEVTTIKNELLHSINNRVIQKVEKIIRQKGRETRFFDTTIYPLISNGISGAVIRVDDITERIRLEERISLDLVTREKTEKAFIESEEKFKSIFENSPLAIVQFDIQGLVTTCNENFCKILGISEDKLIGLNMLKPLTDHMMLDSLSVALSGNKSQYEGEYQSFVGDIKTPIRANFAPVLSIEGTVTGAVGIFEDITERLAGEKKNKGLESQLQQAQKMEALGTLAGGIAHDFNNILFPLVGYAEMLKMDLPADHPFQSNADIMLSSALRAKDLVQQILTFSRKSESEMKPIKLQPVVDETIKLLRSSIPKTIEMNQNIDSGCGSVNADPTKIHQIIMNMATNAYHAMEEAGGNLTITLKQVRIEHDHSLQLDLLPGTYARLTFMDTGIGIGKDVIDKVFDPYFTTKETGKGTGLGLSVVHGIVKECGGDIRIYSESGKGTDIQVYIPIIEMKTAKIAESTGILTGGTERILLVDDEEVVAGIEQLLLERLGYKVTMRTGSVEALEAFKANPGKYDMIVTDMTMPNMSGIQFAQEIKKITPTIPIIICTGFSYQLTDEKCQALGIQGYVLKPVIIRELALAIRKALDS